jgi:hypothetical protein
MANSISRMYTVAPHSEHRDFDFLIPGAKSNTAKCVKLLTPMKNTNEREITSLYENSHFGDARYSG